MNEMTGEPRPFVLPNGYHPYRSALIGGLAGGPLVPLFVVGCWWIALLWLGLVAVGFWLTEYPLRTAGMIRARRRHFLAECAAGRHELPCGWCGFTETPGAATGFLFHIHPPVASDQHRAPLGGAR